jgi:deoxycytidylate deaminase
MSEIIQNLSEPELFFGFVAPIGTNIDDSIKALRTKIEAHGYSTVPIKITGLFPRLAKELPIPTELVDHPFEARYNSYIDFGDNIREYFDDDSILASCAVQKIVDERRAGITDPKKGPSGTAYVLYQFKRKEELELLRSVYGPLFFQISVYSKRSARVDNLARKIALSHNSADSNRYRDLAERLVRRDENEIEDEHGQRVSDVFHEADFIVNTDLSEVPSEIQITRLVDLIFGSNSISPTKSEYGLYIAKSTSIRSVDLSRQVGAAIFSQAGEIVTLGANEVPKAGGGTYWCDDDHDNRDFRREEDSNDRRKRELLSELAPIIAPECDLDSVLSDSRIRNSQFMDALEYGRTIHAEMSAISDAARLGRALKDTVLYCTTFPCHMCTKHIVAAGISQVVYLEPYPKSLASELHGDSIEIEGQSRGEYGSFPSCKFRHFYGVSPRRYCDFFETKKKRKNEKGVFRPWRFDRPQPIVEVKVPTYLFLETHIISGVLIPALKKTGVSDNVFSDRKQRNAKGGRSKTARAAKPKSLRNKS